MKARPSLPTTWQAFRMVRLPAGELLEQRDAICRFGVDPGVLIKIAKALHIPAG